MFYYYNSSTELATSCTDNTDNVLQLCNKQSTCASLYWRLDRVKEKKFKKNNLKLKRLP